MEGAGPNSKLTTEQRVYFRNQLRDARALTLKDGENFSRVVFVLERLGILLTGGQAGLFAYENELDKLARQSALYEASHELVPNFRSLFRLLRKARNDSMHVGAQARHAASSAVRLAIVLEDALMANAELLRDFMVTSPVTAQMWHPIGFIRQQMLENSFSFIPFEDLSGNWKLVSDSMLALLLRGLSGKERSERLAMSLQSAIDECLVQPFPAIRMPSGTAFSEVRTQIDQKPILLFSESRADQLVGLVTAFDLL